MHTLLSGALQGYIAVALLLFIIGLEMNSLTLPEEINAVH